MQFPHAPLKSYYVYKYYEKGFEPFSPPFKGELLPQIAPPRAIEVQSPQLDFGPFKIATEDVNGDGFADFALTWKNIKSLATLNFITILF